jgi:hypothetical protein
MYMFCRDELIAASSLRRGKESGMFHYLGGILDLCHLKNLGRGNACIRSSQELEESYAFAPIQPRPYAPIVEVFS